jgi:plastocyanin
MTMFKSLALSSALGAAAGIALAAQVLAQGTSVSIESFKFAPATITTNANAPITFVNKDGAPHQVVVSGKPFKTAVLQKGQSGSITIADKGSYKYICGLHPSMTGTIEVK